MRLPKFAIENDFIAGNNITASVLSLYTYYPVRLEAGVLVLCVRGRVTVSLGLTQHEVKEGDFLVLPPGIFFQAKDMTEDLQLYFCAFSAQMLENLNFSQITLNIYSAFYFHPIIHLPEAHFQIYKEAFNLIVHAEQLSMQGNAILTHSLVEGIIGIFLKGCAQLMTQQETDTDNMETHANAEVSKRFLCLVTQEYRKEHRVSYYAQAMGIPLNKLCSIIRKQLRTTALQVIDSMIILDAKFQLKSTTDQIKQISLRLGFDNHAFFAKYFKKHTGMTPVEYRKS